MAKQDKITLIEARETGAFDQFMKEPGNPSGDAEALKRTIRSMAGTSKEAPEASSPDDCDD